MRSVRTQLDSFAHRADVDYRVWRLQGKEVVAELHETHALRFFFPQELALLFESAGMLLLDLRAFGDADAPPSESMWSVLAVGRAVRVDRRARASAVARENGPLSVPGTWACAFRETP